MKPPEPLYPCHFCNEEYSWPASDLHWSNRFSDWVCGECWCDNCHDDDYEPDEMGVRLSDYLKETTAQELAALRAKAKMVDDGEQVYLLDCGVNGADRFVVINRPPEYILKQKGYTCEPVTIVRKEKR